MAFAVAKIFRSREREKNIYYRYTCDIRIRGHRTHRAWRVATSLVNSVSRCSWYALLVRDQGRAREKGGATAARLWRSHAAARDARRVATAPAYYAGLCSLLPLWCERPRGPTRLDATRRGSTRAARHRADSDNPAYVRGLLGDREYRYSLSIFRHWHYLRRSSGCGDRELC